MELPEQGIDLYKTLSDIEDSLIMQAMARANDNVQKAADLLCLNRTTLKMKLINKGIIKSEEMAIDPLGEFTVECVHKGLFHILYNGESIATCFSARSANKLLKEKLNE